MVFSALFVKGKQRPPLGDQGQEPQTPEEIHQVHVLQQAREAGGRGSAQPAPCKDTRSTMRKDIERRGFKLLLSRQDQGPGALHAAVHT